jgi:hypothetical protein
MTYQLGRNQNTYDPKDLLLRELIFRVPTDIVDMIWGFPGQSTDQGTTPHCVGFTGANYRINLPTYTPQTNADGDKYYYKAVEYDGNPNSENGSTSRSLAKTLVFYGAIKAYAFIYDQKTFDYWLRTQGPIPCGTNWYNGMFTPDENNIIHCNGDVAGGHEYLIKGIKGDDINGFYRIRNSWGDGYGDHGEVWIPKKEFWDNFKNGGDAFTAIELDPTVPIDPTPKPDSLGCPLSAVKTGFQMLKRIIR